MSHSVQTATSPNPTAKGKAAAVHPSAKLILFILVGSLALIFQDPRYLAGVVLLHLLIVTRIGWTRTLLRTFILLGGVSSVFTAISWLFFVRVGDDVYWEGALPWIGYTIQITDTGVLWSIGMGLRIATLVLLSMFYLFTTSPREIAIALRGIGIPFSIGFLISLIFRFIPLVKNDLATIREAQMVRGVRWDQGGLLAKMKAYVTLIVPLIFTSLKRVQLIANALDSKGFQIRNRRHRYYRMPRWKGYEIGWILISACVVGCCLYWARIHPGLYGILIPTRI
ncbi:energy-coupling factor transporter transmembrane protein EcfT [Paenibacillus sp. J2TS4]|uniref:energy-coupling factor transporter transmembrane component T family protein n=1 Tax=Paenibacillus sp. J2TS4 TaxID=2807194 RepID=UPI001B19D5A9|nr:energy-coupling factor transporter transmembrane component T [Paenibacillus sp. J2TS4]GIP31214.1 transporter [Paenibacillus sp. J2TS4]